MPHEDVKNQFSFAPAAALRAQLFYIPHCSVALEKICHTLSDLKNVEATCFLLHRNSEVDTRAGIQLVRAAFCSINEETCLLQLWPSILLHSPRLSAKQLCTLRDPTKSLLLNLFWLISVHAVPQSYVTFPVVLYFTLSFPFPDTVQIMSWKTKFE